MKINDIIAEEQQKKNGNIITRVPERTRRNVRPDFGTDLASVDDWITPWRSALGEQIFALAARPETDGANIIEKSISDNLTEISKFFPIEMAPICLNDENIHQTYKDERSGVEFVTQYSLPDIGLPNVTYIGFYRVSNAVIRHHSSMFRGIVAFTYAFLPPNIVHIRGPGPLANSKFSFLVFPKRSIKGASEIPVIIDAEVGKLHLATCKEYLFNKYYNVMDSDFFMGQKLQLTDFADAKQEKDGIMEEIGKKSIRHSANTLMLLRR